MVAAAGLDTSRKDPKVPICCMQCLVIVEDVNLELQAPYRLWACSGARLFAPVGRLTRSQNEDYCPMCATVGWQICWSMGLNATIEFHLSG